MRPAAARTSMSDRNCASPTSAHGVADACPAIKKKAKPKQTANAVRQLPRLGFIPSSLDRAMPAEVRPPSQPPERAPPFVGLKFAVNSATAQQRRCVYSVRNSSERSLSSRDMIERCCGYLGASVGAVGAPQDIFEQFLKLLRYSLDRVGGLFDTRLHKTALDRCDDKSRQALGTRCIHARCRELRNNRCAPRGERLNAGNGNFFVIYCSFLQDGRDRTAVTEMRFGHPLGEQLSVAADKLGRRVPTLREAVECGRGVGAALPDGCFGDRKLAVGEVVIERSLRGAAQLHDVVEACRGIALPPEQDERRRHDRFTVLRSS